MKTIIIAFLSILSVTVTSCSKNDEINEITLELSNLEKQDLIFLREEEKLARDTYTFLGDLWAINQFNNIKQSEQTHMNAIVNLLENNDIQYTILPYGEFNNQELQALYDEFKTHGATSNANALQIGATIEDLVIVDLQYFIDMMSYSSLV